MTFTTIALFVLAVVLGLFLGGGFGKVVRTQRTQETAAQSETKVYGWCDNLVFKLGALAIGVLLIAYGVYAGSFATKVLGVFATCWAVAYWWRRTHPPAESYSGW